MKRKYLYTLAVISAVIMVFVTIGRSSQFGASPQACAAPGDGYTSAACGNQACHNKAPIKGSSALAISLIDANNDQVVTTYQASKNYKVRIEITDNTMKACGFESTIEKKSNNTHVGTMTTIIGSNCQFTGFEPTYVTHMNSALTSPGYGKWEYMWTSPASDLGEVVLYAAANAANGDGSNAGDKIYTSNKSFLFNPSAAIDSKTLIATSVNVFPNPVRDNFTISYFLGHAASTTIDLYSINGQYIRNIQTTPAIHGENNATANISDVPAGVYFVKITVGGETSVLKIFKD